MRIKFISVLTLISIFFFAFAQNSFSGNAPIISERVSRAVNQNQKVRVMIKLKEAYESPSVSRMTTAKDPARFISRRSVRRLQAKLESSFTAGELNSDINIVHRLENIPWVTGKISQRALNRLRNNPNVAMVSEDLHIRAFLAESGPMIGSDTAHGYGFTGRGINVAVLDTGIDTDHPELQDDIIREECFLDTGCPITGTSRASGPGSAEDGDDHGTHVSGIITSSNSIYKGIAPDAGIVAIKVLNNEGNGYTSNFVAAADWMITNSDTYDIRVINMSLGTYDVFPGECDKLPGIPPENQAGIDALNAARNAGIAVFASSGNDAETANMSAPACISSVISVGAVYDANVGFQGWSGCSDSFTSADKVVCFSNVSSALDILAPGSITMSSGRGGGSTSMSGTSMSSPHAAGVAALMLDKNPGLTVDEIESILKNTGTSIYDSRVGVYKDFPRINAAAALNSVEEANIHPYDTDEDCVIDDFELLNAIDDWAAGNLGDFELLDLIDFWAGGSYC